MTDTNNNKSVSTRRELARTSMLAAFISIGIFGPVLWMVIDRDVPFIVSGGHIDPANATEGGNVTITWEISSERSCQPSKNSTVTRTVIDAKGVRHNYVPVPATYGSSSQQRAADQIQRPFQLPDGVTGQAKYTSLACYACNPVQELWPICIQMPEVPFNIQPKEDQT